MFYDINKGLCDTYPGLDPLKLLDYSSEDVFDLIIETIDYNNRNDKKHNKANTIRRPASDNWF